MKCKIAQSLNNHLSKVLLTLFVLVTSLLTAQVKIGENPNSIDSSSILELESTTRVMVLSRVTTAQMQTIVPLQGALVYNIDEQCVFYFDTATWKNLCNSDDPGNGDIATLVNNGDDTYTFTNVNGVETIISFDGLIGGSTLVNNGDGTYTFTDGNNVETVISINGLGGGSTLVDNGDDTYTFTNTAGGETIISLTGGSQLMGTTGSIFFAGADGNATENNNELFWDDTNARLGIGTNTGLNDKLTVQGSIGVSSGSATEPSYRFSEDLDTGMYRNVADEIGFSVGSNERMKVSSTSLYINQADPFNDFPVVIRAGDASELIAFQFRNGATQWHLDLNGPGLNFIETNVQNNRLFFMNNGGLGIETGNPTETLDVAGTFRVRQLDPSQTTDNFVTVDANGVFHRSVTTSNSGKKAGNTLTKKSAKWTNGNIKIGLNFGDTVAPIFALEEFNDDDKPYMAKDNSLLIKSPGRYEIRSNLSLIGDNTTSAGQIATISARIHINGLPMGAIAVAANNGSKNAPVLSSLQTNELLELNVGDVITIIVYTDAIANTIYFNAQGTSSFTITKVN